MYLTYNPICYICRYTYAESCRMCVFMCISFCECIYEQQL